MNNEKLELEANQFAMELLMPEDLLNQVIKDIGNIESEQEIIYLANMFEVSIPIMTLRLNQLKLIKII